MADRSEIEWTDATWNPIRARLLNKVGDKAKGSIGWHCEHVTPGCELCYAERFNQRLGTGLPFKPGHRKDVEIFLDDNMLQLPLRWKKPRKIFVGSMTDLFADFVTDEMLDKIVAVMALSPQHTFQVLTKRAERMREYLSRSEMPRNAMHHSLAFQDHLPGAGECWTIVNYHFANLDPADLFPLPNVWLGVSCENQEQADARIPLLLQTPAVVRFISAEPLLGPIDLTRIDIGSVETAPGARVHRDALAAGGNRLDWVIAGGESGPKARPMHPDWARGLRDQCKAAGVAFHFKQHGEWLSWSQFHSAVEDDHEQTRFLTEEWRGDHWQRVGYPMWCDVTDGNVDDNQCVGRVGKKAAGRLLDGVEHNAFPTGSAA